MKNQVRLTAILILIYLALLAIRAEIMLYQQNKAAQQQEQIKNDSFFKRF